jgi:hypothetical protein
VTFRWPTPSKRRAAEGKQIFAALSRRITQTDLMLGGSQHIQRKNCLKTNLGACWRAAADARRFMRLRSQLNR